MSGLKIPSTQELYEEARKVDAAHREDYDPGYWGRQPNQEGLSNYFVWDTEPVRFNYDTCMPDELVISTPVYGAFVNGTGFNLETPLEDDRDRADVREVFGEESIQTLYRGSPGIQDIDTPLDTLKTHYLAKNLDIDVYSPLNFEEPLDRWEDEEKPVFYKEWEKTARSSLNDLLLNYTTRVSARDFSDMVRQFAGNGKNSAFIMYASRNNGRYSEDKIETVNAHNQGGMSYHTPGTINKLLVNNLS